MTCARLTANVAVQRASNPVAVATSVTTTTIAAIPTNSPIGEAVHAGGSHPWTNAGNGRGGSVSTESIASLVP